MLIINANIYTMEDSIIKNGFIKIKGKIIEKIGDMKDVPKYEGQIIDAFGNIVCPGFVDVHTHLGIVEDSIGFEGDDVNETTDPITPELRAIDAINPFDRAFKESLLSGVTTVLVSAGSANAIAGQMALIKTDGICIDDMILDDFIGMKFALGENPKSVYSSKTQSPSTRMATTALIRENLFKARQYMENKEKAEFNEEDLPDFEIKYEALIPVLQKKVKAHFHVHRADDIFTAVRICKEFDIDLVLVHATESYMIAEKIKQYPMIIGPSLTDRSKPELSNLSLETPKILAEKDILFSISTDHPETPLKFLTLCASVAVKEGLDEMIALKCITINPAKIVGLDDKIGSIKVGKDADLVIFSKNPLEYTAKIINVIINGELKI